MPMTLYAVMVPCDSSTLGWRIAGTFPTADAARKWVDDHKQGVPHAEYKVVRCDTIETISGR
jgi:hypothetical protein